MRRFTLKLHLGYLEYESRRRLVATALQDKGARVAEGEGVVESAATRTEGWSASDILTLCGDAAEVRVGEAVEALRIGLPDESGRENWKVTDEARTAMAALRDVTAEDFRRAEVMLVGSGDGLLC